LTIDPDLLARTVHAFRIGNLVMYSWVAVNGVSPFMRIVTRAKRSGDRIASTLLILSMSLIIFQIRSLARFPRSSTDVWTAIGLFGLLLSASLFCLNRLKSVPSEHKRAVLMANASVLIISLAAGALA
jgi:hypothetical protein